jgi:hypothetical protein
MEGNKIFIKIISVLVFIVLFGLIDLRVYVPIVSTAWLLVIINSNKGNKIVKMLLVVIIVFVWSGKTYETICNIENTTKLEKAISEYKNKYSKCPTVDELYESGIIKSIPKPRWGFRSHKYDNYYITNKCSIDTHKAPI